MAENASDETAGDGDSSMASEEVEPKLKYTRISNDLRTLLAKDAVSCIAVHPKFLCLGTHWGAVHLLDHEGNATHTAINEKNVSHMVSVNGISMDLKGEYIGTCSDDGLILINGLYTNDNDMKLNIGKPVKCLALDPFHYKPGSGKKFITGNNGLILYEKTFLKGMKSTLLSESEGYVCAVSWNDQFVAWASSLGVRVYDLKDRCSLGLIKWEEQKDVSTKDFRCNLKWSNATTLLIGWCDTIRICVIRKRNANEITTKHLPPYLVDPISTFQTEFYICGLAPLENNQLVVLGYPKERDADNNKALLCVLQYNTNDYVEICTDILSLRGYAEYTVNDYQLDCLIDENRYYIVSPKDVVVASLYEVNDRIQWLIDHGKFEEALNVISTFGGSYSDVSVARLYLNHLLDEKQYEAAAQLCSRVFRDDTSLWEEEIYKFVQVHQLRTISKYIPHTESCKLKPHVYEMVLYEFLQLDPPGFLDIIKDWPPSLYNATAIINVVNERRGSSSLSPDEKSLLYEALAILYMHDQKYEKALKIFLKLQQKDVFVLIKKHDLYSIIQGLIIPLIELDNDKAMEMLLERDKIPPDTVVEELGKRGEYLHMYLDAYDKVDSAGKYHSRLVELHAKYSPDKLLPFLKRSNNYSINSAFEICKRRTFYPEMVYLLGRMGNTREALSIIIHKLNNIQKAIDFCREHDDIDLWNDLINESIDKTDVMTKLLDGVTGFINPELLVNKIKLGQSIPGLKSALVKMLAGYSLQVAIQDNCNQILVTDYFHLHKQLVEQQQRSMVVTVGGASGGGMCVCELCGREIVVIEESNVQDILAYNCKHFFHDNCLSDKTVDHCAVCHSDA
jgi:vacuolar protein sorting-associated protein 41